MYIVAATCRLLISTTYHDRSCTMYDVLCTSCIVQGSSQLYRAAAQLQVSQLYDVHSTSTMYYVHRTCTQYTYIVQTQSTVIALSALAARSQHSCAACVACVTESRARLIIREKIKEKCGKGRHSSSCTAVAHKISSQDPRCDHAHARIIHSRAAIARLVYVRCTRYIVALLCTCTSVPCTRYSYDVGLPCNCRATMYLVLVRCTCTMYYLYKVYTGINKIIAERALVYS